MKKLYDIFIRQGKQDRQLGTYYNPYSSNTLQHRAYDMGYYDLKESDQTDQLQ